MGPAIHKTSRERKLIEMGCGDLVYHSMGFYLSSIRQEVYGLGMTTLSYGIIRLCKLLRNQIFHSLGINNPRDVLRCGIPLN
jgi:hypothetical protein